MNQSLQHAHLFRGREGFEAWHGDLASSCGTFHVEPPLDDRITRFQGAVTALDSQRSHIEGARITSNCSHVHRSLRDIRGDDKDFFYLVMQLDGEALIDQCDRETRLTRGDLVLLDVARPSDFRFRGLSDQVSVILPRSDVLLRFREQRLCLNQRIEAGSAIGAMSAMLVRQLTLDSQLSSQESQAVLDAILALLRPVLTSQPGEPAQVAPSVVMNKAKAFIEHHLADESLCPERIAAAAGTSVRNLHRLFAQADTSVGRYILQRRLQRCAEAILQSELKITHIALSWGFKELSHFSRAFKSEFRVSPSAYREAHG
ncbi:transcriptional regulator FeaR [Pseudomonas wadenswilerensis]